MHILLTFANTFRTNSLEQLFYKAAFSQLEQENEKLRQKLEEARIQTLERDEEQTRKKEEDEIKKSEEKSSRKQFEERLKAEANLVTYRV